LAKQQEELFLPGQDDPVVLPRTSAALHLVQRIRDETHRFAITFHRQQRQRSGLSSSLDTVTGIGPKRRQALVRRFGSPRGVMEASVEELTAVPGITTALAQRLKLSLGYG
jgi:excinuclease ABC subunit C